MRAQIVDSCRRPKFEENSFSKCGKWGERVAPLEIKTTLGGHYFVKVVPQYSRHPVVTVFIRGGYSVNLDLPLGSYTIKYATGRTWYGYQRLFGPDTSYMKADKTFEFEKIPGGARGYTLLLYAVPDGNLTTTKINRDDF